MCVCECECCVCYVTYESQKKFRETELFSFRPCSAYKPWTTYIKKDFHMIPYYKMQAVNRIT